MSHFPQPSGEDWFQIALASVVTMLLVILIQTLIQK